MRVALACPYAWDAPGGVQVHVRQLAAHLRRRGHDVLVLTPASVPVDEPGVTVVARAVRVPYQGTVAPIAPSLASIRRAGAALRAFRPDVLHAHEPLTPSSSMAAVLSAAVPVVATFHAYAERSRLLDLAAPLLRPVWRRLTVRVAVSEAAAAFVSSRFAGEVRVVPNGCDVEPFAAAGRAPRRTAQRRLLWVGRLDPQKGFPVAVAAFGRLAAERPDLRFVVVGEGRDRAALDDLAPDVLARIELAGTVAHRDLPGFHAGAEAFVSPALGQESFGIVLVEAMAAGLPVVASDIAGYREVVRDGREGLLVPPGDPEALAEALRRVLDDPALAGALGEAGRRRAERYRWERVAGEVEAAYGEALARA